MSSSGGGVPPPSPAPPGKWTLAAHWIALLLWAWRRSIAKLPPNVLLRFLHGTFIPARTLPQPLFIFKNSPKPTLLLHHHSPFFHRAVSSTVPLCLLPIDALRFPPTAIGLNWHQQRRTKKQRPSGMPRACETWVQQRGLDGQSLDLVPSPPVIWPVQTNRAER